MLSKHADLEVVGLTESSDREAIDAFRNTNGVTYPVLFGVTAATKDAYGLAKAPSLRVLDRQGRRAGDDLTSLERVLSD